MWFVVPTSLCTIAPTIHNWLLPLRKQARRALHLHRRIRQDPSWEKNKTNMIPSRSPRFSSCVVVGDSSCSCFGWDSSCCLVACVGWAEAKLSVACAFLSDFLWFFLWSDWSAVSLSAANEARYGIGSSNISIGYGAILETMRLLPGLHNLLCRCWWCWLLGLWCCLCWLLGLWLHWLLSLWCWLCWLFSLWLCWLFSLKSFYKNWSKPHCFVWDTVEYSQTYNQRTLPLVLVRALAWESFTFFSFFSFFSSLSFLCFLVAWSAFSFNACALSWSLLACSVLRDVSFSQHFKALASTIPLAFDTPLTLFQCLQIARSQLPLITCFWHLLAFAVPTKFRHVRAGLGTFTAENRFQIQCFLFSQLLQVVLQLPKTFIHINLELGTLLWHCFLALASVSCEVACARDRCFVYGTPAASHTALRVCSCLLNWYALRARTRVPFFLGCGCCSILGCGCCSILCCGCCSALLEAGAHISAGGVRLLSKLL